jgi:hypothetical protein
MTSHPIPPLKVNFEAIYSSKNLLRKYTAPETGTKHHENI